MKYQPQRERWRSMIEQSSQLTGSHLNEIRKEYILSDVQVQAIREKYNRLSKEAMAQEMDESSFVKNEMQVKEEQEEVARASNFKYCIGLSHELELKRQALRKRLHKVVAMRNILLKESISQRGEHAHPSLISKQLTPKYRPQPIDLKKASTKELEAYLKHLFEYSQAEKNQEFSDAVEQIDSKQITPLIWSLSLENSIASNLRKALNQLRTSNPEFIENYMSPELITLLFEQSISHDSKEGLELLISLAQRYSFDLSHLKLTRFGALLDFHLSKLGPAFDSSFSTLYLQYYLHQQNCYLALNQEIRTDANIAPLLKFASQFYKDSIPKDAEGEDILFNTVQFQARFHQLQGMEEEVSQFLITRVQNENSHILLHSTLKSAPLKLTYLVINKLKDFQYEHQYLPFSQDALRHFYINVVKKQKQLKCGELWAYLFKQLGMTAELFDLTKSWRDMTHSDLYLPLMYLTDALLAHNIEPSTAHNETKEIFKKFEVDLDHPVAVVSKMKAFLKQNQPKLAAGQARKLVNQSENEQAQLISIYHKNFGENALSPEQFSARYGTLLKKLDVQREFDPIVSLISQVLARQDYVSLKWLFNYCSAAHRRANLLEQVQELRRERGTSKEQIAIRQQAARQQVNLMKEAEEELELIDKKRLKQLQKHIERKEFIEAAGRSSDLGQELKSLNQTKKNELVTQLHSSIQQSDLWSPLKSLSGYLKRKRLETAQVEQVEGENEIKEQSVKDFKTVHQEVITELKGIGFTKGTPEYIAMYTTGILMGKAERGQLVGSLESSHQMKERKQFSDWMQVQLFLRVICDWLEEYQPLLKRGLYEGNFESYVWDYVVDPQKAGFLSTGIKKGVFLKTTHLSQEDIGKVIFNTLNVSELHSKNLVSEIRNLASKLPKNFENLLLQLREKKTIIIDSIPAEIEKYKKLHPRDQKAKIQHHKLEAQRLITKIIYSAGLQTDLDAIRKEFNQVVQALDIKEEELDQASWGEEQALREKKAEFEGKIDPQLSKEQIGFLMLRSRRNKIRLERLRSKLESFKKCDNVSVDKYGSVAKLFKEIVRIHYLQDLNTHSYLVSLPGITQQQIRETVRDRRKILTQQIQRSKKGTSRLNLDAAQLYKAEWLKVEVEKQPNYRLDLEKQKLATEGDIRVVSVNAAPGKIRKYVGDWPSKDRYINPIIHRDDFFIHYEDQHLGGRDMDHAFRIKKGVEQVNLFYTPAYDRYNPHIMRQAAFNTALLSLKPLLLTQLSQRKEIAQSFIKAQFSKLARDTTFKPEAYELSSVGDLEYRDGKLELKDALLTLQKICVVVDDERSPLSIALERYNYLKELSPIEVAERVSGQSILVEQHTLQELYADLEEKELLMAALENHYLDLMTKERDSRVTENQTTLEIADQKDGKFQLLFNRIYSEYSQVVAQKEKNLHHENKSRQKHGLEKKTKLSNDKTQLPLVRQMLGVEGRWETYGQEMMEFGIQQKIPEALRIGEYLMRGKPVDKVLAKRVSAFLEEAQIEYNQSMTLTGPLEIGDIYSEQGNKRKRSIWRDDHSKLGGLERFIPLEKVKEIRKLDRRLG